MVKKQKKIILDEFEKEILEAYENGKLKPSKARTDYQTIAQNTMKKNRKINIRISENDLTAIQRRAAREGIPYQTLIGSILHKYASGFLNTDFHRWFNRHNLTPFFV
jgi:predicted DNA binding CopG/RHH family protein